jgi:hypothetical protein
MENSYKLHEHLSKSVCIDLMAGPKRRMRFWCRTSFSHLFEIAFFNIKGEKQWKKKSMDVVNHVHEQVAAAEGSNQ